MGQLAYLDSSAIMRIAEASTTLGSAVREAAAGRLLKTSTISITECLPIPIRISDVSTLSIYEQLFSRDEIEIVTVDEAIARLAAEFRARFRLKTPDALHFATAAARRCDVLITTDSDYMPLNGIEGVQVVLLPAV